MLRLRAFINAMPILEAIKVRKHSNASRLTEKRCGEMEQQNKSKQSFKIILLLFLAIGLVISFLPFGAGASWRHIFSFFGLNDFSSAADSSPLSVHVLEVGKADCIFIECKGKYMLVDGGTMDCGEPVSEYLDRRGVERLDYIINTHPDKDHIGGLATIIAKYDIGSYLAPEIPASLIPVSEEYVHTQKALEKKNMRITTPNPLDTFDLNGLKIEVLAPLKQGDSTNNNSIVLRLAYGETRFLLMGDAEKEEEADLLASGYNLSADVLKVGHHGSRTSTTEEFIRKVKPHYTAISVADDSNHLPKREVLKRLKSTESEVLRTDVNGTLIFMSDGQTISVVTAR